MKDHNYLKWEIRGLRQLLRSKLRAKEPNITEVEGIQKNISDRKDYLKMLGFNIRTSKYD